MSHFMASGYGIPPVVESRFHETTCAIYKALRGADPHFDLLIKDCEKEKQELSNPLHAISLDALEKEIERRKKTPEANPAKRRREDRVYETDER
jgi:hypothetical protein